MANRKIEDFFNGRFFEIPKYQRGYSWERQNVRELFDDIVESIESNSNHYIGTIVLSKSNDPEKFYIVDGQQRTTTISLIISALIKQLSEMDKMYFERFYLKEDGHYRITPLSRDKDYFINMLEGKVFEPSNKSQRFLKEAFEEISFKVSEIKDKKEFLNQIRKLTVMEFTEDSEGDAIRIFQTVNDRGKPLSNLEKAKSLLIYFSNKYLNKQLDDEINNIFSDIFEIYDDIKHLGEKLGITLISSKEFSEDNLMRYHFVTFSNENYDPSASYVLDYLKRNLNDLRSQGIDKNFEALKNFIEKYVKSLKDFFVNCEALIRRAEIETKFYKLLVILNLSATLYPLATKMQSLNLFNKQLKGKGFENFNFFDLLELIEVRVYKTRGTDPKADMANLVYNIEDYSEEQIQEFLIWFNARWMSKEEFQSALAKNVYGNRALPYIFITYCEEIEKHQFALETLKNFVAKSPNIEHTLSQTPNFDPVAIGFKDKEDFVDFEHDLGNLTILEKSFNSSIHNRNVLDKVDTYNKSVFVMTRKLASQISSSKSFGKNDVISRTQILLDFCLNKWWA